MDINLPVYAQPLFRPFRYKVLYGGRGSAKSYTFAKLAVLLGQEKKLKILCGREYQNSIKDSVISLIALQIKELGLSHKYTVYANSIVGTNGTEFMFKGLYGNIESIKSIPNIDIMWLEEADNVSKHSWDTLVPTIREDGSEIWVSYNPKNEDDPTHKKFVNTANPPDDAFIMKVNWQDNPWFPEVLRKEKDFMYRTNPDLALHVWEGECRTNSDAQIFKGKWIYKDFDVSSSWDGPYFGADWGFSIDPSTLIKMYIDIPNMNIMIRNEFYEVGVEIDDLPKKFDMIPESRERMIYGDCSRPETISYMARQGFMIEGGKKWKGSVEDGIEWLKSFNQIIIHTDCPNMRNEARKYSYKIDRLTQEVTTKIEDKNNHGWDAVRYGLGPMITAGNLGIYDVL